MIGLSSKKKEQQMSLGQGNTRRDSSGVIGNKLRKQTHWLVGNSDVSQLKGKELGRRQLLYPVYFDLWHDVKVETELSKRKDSFLGHIL